MQGRRGFDFNGDDVRCRSDQYTELNGQASFFVVGRLAREHTDLIRRLVDEEHEIACHGFSHRPLWELTPNEFRLELRCFADSLNDAVGRKQVNGFRALTLSLDQRTAWAVEILQEFDYTYDSSIFPIRDTHYGVPDTSLGPYRISGRPLSQTSHEGLIELPLTTLRIAGHNIPLAGGFYLRTIPSALSIRGLRYVASQRSLVLYFNPWEFSPSTPRLRLLLRDWFITYHGFRSSRRKLGALLREFRFMRMVRLAKEFGASKARCVLK